MVRGKAVEIDTTKTLHYIQAFFYFFWDIRFFFFFYTDDCLHLDIRKGREL